MKKLLIFASAIILAFSLTGCGNSKSTETKNSDKSTSSEQDSSDSESGAEDSDDIGANVPMITNDEISKLTDNQFYVANAMSKNVTEFYIAVSNSGEWSSNYLASQITSGSRILLTFSDLDTSVKYDIKVVTDGGEKTEYYGFDMKSTVQITLYDNAQCDVATV